MARLEKMSREWLFFATNETRDYPDCDVFYIANFYAWKTEH